MIMKFKTLILGATTALLLSACGANEAEISEQAENAGLENEVSNVPFEEQEDKLTSSGSEFYRSVVPYELSPARGLSSANMVSSYNVEELEKEFKDKGAEALIVKADVSKSEQVQEFIKAVIEKYGKIDVLVNNAGITRDMLLMRMKEEDFDKVIEINLKGTFLVTKEVVPYMMKKRDGKIISLSSVVGVTGNAGQCNYSASKAGIIGFTKSIAKELASRNIRANAVAPGFIDTDMTNVLSDEVKENINKQIPMRRMGTAREIANVVYFLGSEESSYITGQVINIDGGMVC